jgi:hypothetical protein
MAEMEDFGDGQGGLLFRCINRFDTPCIDTRFHICTNPVWEDRGWRTPTLLPLNLRPPQQSIGRNPDCGSHVTL